MRRYPKIQSDSELDASTDSDSSIDLEFGPPTPKIQIISPDTAPDDDNPIDDDSIESDNSSDDELGISVSSPIVLKIPYQCHHPLCRGICLVWYYAFNTVGGRGRGGL